jgi:hypothetical protein
MMNEWQVQCGEGIMAKRRPDDEDDREFADDEELEERETRRRRRREEGDQTGGLIPYKNGPALAAYYCGVFSLIPCLGIILGIIALVLGIVGWNKYRQNPRIHGAVHAWIGIILGGGCALANILVIVLMIIAAASGGRR